MTGVPAMIVMAAALHAWGGPFVPSKPPSIFGRDTSEPSIFGRDTSPGKGESYRGNLDKEIIRRIIRRHIDEVKACYEPQLAKQPGLGGRVLVKFTIASSGTVIESILESSTMGSATVDNCVVSAVGRWQFPKPLGGGLVIVSYPFILTPAGDGPKTPASGVTTRVLEASSRTGAAEVVLLAGGGFVHRSFDADGVPSNGMIWPTERGLLLVDTAWTDEQTEAILKWGEQHFRKPWLGAVITHEHADRDGGLGALVARRIPTAALDLTVAKLARRGVRDVSVLFAAKDVSFKDPRGFEAFYPGPGHAPDNIVLRFPNVLFGGCLIKSREATDLGFTGAADLAAWPAAVRRVVARYGKMAVVPGHGPVDPDGTSFQHTLELLTASR